MSVNRGQQHLWDLMFSQEVLNKVGCLGSGIVMVKLPVTSLPRHRSLAPHCIMWLAENFDVVLLLMV
jgi:hypothetical protein